MSDEIRMTIENESEMETLGKQLSQVIRPPLLITFDGPLGAGKTFLIRSLVSNWGIDPREVVSPTYTLCQSYQAHVDQALPFAVHHLDAYRVKSDDEFLELGVDELFEEQAVVFLEWAERVSTVLPEDFLAIQIEPVDANARRLSIRPSEGMDAPFASKLLKSIGRDC